jgi:hypothetical protein
VDKIAADNEINGLDVHVRDLARIARRPCGSGPHLSGYDQIFQDKADAS